MACFPATAVPGRTPARSVGLPDRLVPPLIPEAEQLLADQKRSINWPVGRTEMTATALSDGGGTRLTLSTWTPIFSRFEARVADGTWDAVSGHRLDVPATSRQRRSFRAVNAAHLPGEATDWTS